MEPVLGLLGVAALSLTAPVALYTLLRLLGLYDRGLLHRLRRRWSGTSPDDAHVARPIEQIAADVRRLGQRYHCRQVSHVKAESLRHAYDHVLTEACEALGVEHLLGVLEPGADLDRERLRVEGALHRWGVDLSGLDDAA